MIHVLLLSYPSQGHINPLLQFAKRLASHGGVRCTLATTRSVLASTNPSAGSVQISGFSDGGGLDEAGDISAYLPRLESFGSDDVDDLLRSESAEGRPVGIVVYDPLLPWAARVARRHGVPCAAFFTQACSVNLAYAHAWTGLATLPVGEDTADLPGLPAGLKPRDFPSYLTEERSNFPVYAELALNQLQELTSADHVLVNSFYELQPEEAEYMALAWGAVTVGPTVPSAYLDNRMPEDASYGLELHVPMAAACRAWLDGRPERSVAYVSFGSLVTLTAAQTAQLAEGLCGGAMPCFLWVVRASETPKLPEGFAERANAQGRGLVVEWSPQLEVLAHPAIGCFLTHCGWNSTTEALAAGVPMVAMPQWSDQTMNAKYIEDVWRVGVRVRADEGDEVITKEELQRCIKEVMEGGKYAQNAASWSRKAKSAMSQGGSSDRNINEFLAKFGHK
ncbi:hypothetical protein ACQ4PT_047316 [Festuca glaucescens]